MRKDCVMPIDLAYQITEDVSTIRPHLDPALIFTQEDVRLNGYNGADTGTKALLAITPKAYLGWCTELQDKPDEFTFARSSMEDGQGAWFVANLETLRKYQQGSAEAVLDRLWDMYFEGEPRSLVKFEDILRGVIEFHAAWTQLHFTRRQKDNIEDGRSEKRVVARRKGGSP